MEKMGCCRTEVRTDEDPQLVTSVQVIDSHLAVVDWLETFVFKAQSVPPSVIEIADAHSPPGLIIARITVLRV
jgi:hypothetical protein